MARSVQDMQIRMELDSEETSTNRKDPTDTKISILKTILFPIPMRKEEKDQLVRNRICQDKLTSKSIGLFRTLRIRKPDEGNSKTGDTLDKHKIWKPVRQLGREGIVRLFRVAKKLLLLQIRLRSIRQESMSLSLKLGRETRQEVRKLIL